MTGLASALLPAVVGGGVGASLTYGLTWFRENRRILDAYRAPQRQAIGDIITATHGLVLRTHEWCTYMPRVVEELRQNNRVKPELFAKMEVSAHAMSGEAMLDVERAFRMGRLTVVDPECWEAMAMAYAGFEKLRSKVVSTADHFSPDHLDRTKVIGFINEVDTLENEFNADVAALVLAAVDRLSPAEKSRNRRRRHEAHERLANEVGRLFSLDLEKAQKAKKPKR